MSIRLFFINILFNTNNITGKADKDNSEVATRQREHMCGQIIGENRGCLSQAGSQRLCWSFRDKGRTSAQLSRLRVAQQPSQKNGLSDQNTTVTPAIIGHSDINIEIFHQSARRGPNLSCSVFSQSPAPPCSAACSYQSISVNLSWLAKAGNWKPR